MTSHFENCDPLGTFEDLGNATESESSDSTPKAHAKDLPDDSEPLDAELQASQRGAPQKTCSTAPISKEDGEQWKRALTVEKLSRTSASGIKKLQTAAQARKTIEEATEFRSPGIIPKPAKERWADLKLATTAPTSQTQSPQPGMQGRRLPIHLPESPPQPQRWQALSFTSTSWQARRTSTLIQTKGTLPGAMQRAHSHPSGSTRLCGAATGENNAGEGSGGYDAMPEVVIMPPEGDYEEELDLLSPAESLNTASDTTLPSSIFSQSMLQDTLVFHDNSSWNMSAAISADAPFRTDVTSEETQELSERRDGWMRNREADAVMCLDMDNCWLDIRDDEDVERN